MELCLLVIKLILCFLTFVFFLVLLLDLKHEADLEDHSDQEGQDKSASEDYR